MAVRASSAPPLSLGVSKGLNMSLLISRLVFTIIVIAVAYFALLKIWTKKVDVTEILKRPSEAIPISKTEIRPELAIHLRFP